MLRCSRIDANIKGPVYIPNMSRSDDTLLPERGEDRASKRSNTVVKVSTKLLIPLVDKLDTIKAVDLFIKRWMVARKRSKGARGRYEKEKLLELGTPAKQHLLLPKAHLSFLRTKLRLFNRANTNER